MIKLDYRHLSKFVTEDDYTSVFAEVRQADKILYDRSGEGSDFLGWLDLPINYDKDEFERIKRAAEQIISDTDIFIVIGIGGSYLGARAAIEFINSPFYNSKKKRTPDIYFAGNNLSPDYLNDILELCEGRNVSLNVISKSGTTTEPAVAFRFLRKYLESRYGEHEAKKRIFVTTDRSKGSLKQLADKQGYECFCIPDDIGGRFSVLTAVGLLPMAVAGIDIDKVMEGAAKAGEALLTYSEDNPCYRYAALRNIFYNKGISLEIFASYEPRLAVMAEWLKQLFGESEGKDGKGLFPSSVNYTTDLHSLGQYIQEGKRLFFETVISINKPDTDLAIEKDSSDFDGLNYLAPRTLDNVNKIAMQGTVLAHTDGGVPNIIIELEDNSPESFGYMVYFFEKACAISAYTLKVNPFDQPGVEGYKNNMFALLGKPGYEELRTQLEGRII